MSRFAWIGVLAAAPLAAAQTWEFELSEPVLIPATPSTTVTLSIDHHAADYAFAGANLSVRASEAGWSDLVALLSLGTPPFGGHPGQVPGVTSGGDVTGITLGQLAAFGWEPRPGRIDVWQATFTATDFTARSIDLSTDTTRFDVYTIFGRAPRTPNEGRGQIQIVPAPAGLALLGLGGVAFAGRRRAAGSPCERSCDEEIVPAPAGLALLGLGGVAFAGRRRAEASRGRRDSR